MTSIRVGAAVLLVVGAACAGGQQPPAKSGTTTAAQQGGGGPMNTLTSQEQKDGWKLLFDGSTTTNWRGYKSQDMPKGWMVKDGALTKEHPTGDIMTSDQFGNFEFSWDWKIAKGGNAGLFYRGTEEYEHVYWSGPEYQLLDDEFADDRHSRLTSAGSAYAVYPSPAGFVKPAGEWNTSRIVVNGAHVEHWLNGHKLLEYELWSPDWEGKVKSSKFVDWPQYGRAKRGYLAFQGDHEGMLALRNIKIRELP
jgi:3-keto-disaccharide hydrolase